MGYQRFDPSASSALLPRWTPPTAKEISIHVLLVLATFATCMMAGAQWVGVNPFEIGNWQAGFSYAVLTMTFLLSHEYGHYLAALRHKLPSSLPYVIPVPPTIMPFGTFGAVIRTRTPMMTKNQLFDIGVSGPIAGFVVCLIILTIGFITLPGVEYLYAIHPEILANGFTDKGLTFGDTLLFSMFRSMFEGHVFVPPMNEIYHYPFLCVGWFGMFVTALNLLPFGQLDGGHVLYALIGRKQHVIGRVLWWTMFSLAVLWLLGLIHDLFTVGFNPAAFSPWVLWLRSTVDPTLGSVIAKAPWLFSLGEVWTFWLIMVRLVIKIEHPVIADESPLSKGRVAIGWIAMLILILSIAPKSIYQVP